MKKLLTLALLASSISSFAATSGTLILKGVVDAKFELSLSALPEALNLNILSGEINKKLATVSETSNNRTGYKISMKSDNAGRLVHLQDNNKYSSYRLKYNNVEFTPTPSFVVVKTVSTLNALSINTSDVVINLDSNASAVAGTYQDTVTFSIEAN